MAGKAKAPSLLDQFRSGLIHDWGVYVCGPRPIDIDGVRAFNVGDAVPASHVSRGVVSENDVIMRDDVEAMKALNAPLAAQPVSDLPGSTSEGTDDATLAEVKRVHGGE